MIIDLKAVRRKICDQMFSKGLPVDIGDGVIVYVGITDTTKIILNSIESKEA